MENILAEIVWPISQVADVVPLLVRLPIDSADAPSTIYMQLRAETGEVQDYALNRNSDQDLNTAEGDVVAYITSNDASFEAPSGTRFTAYFYLNLDAGVFSNPLTIHTSDRWENWLDQQLSSLNIPTLPDRVTTAEAEAASSAVTRLWSSVDVRAAINAGVLDAAEDGNTEAWSLGKIGVWTGTAAAYAALTPVQRASYNLLLTSG